LAMLSSSSSGCARKPDAEIKAPVVMTDDALALLPGEALALGTVDARAVFASPSAGADLAKLIARVTPLASVADWRVERDLDRVTFALYNVPNQMGPDVAAVLIGRFNREKLRQALGGNGSATSDKATSGGASAAGGSGAGDFELYRVNGAVVSVLSESRVVVGSERAVGSVLARVRDHRVTRDLTPSLVSAVETAGASFVFASDAASTPMPSYVAQNAPSALVSTLQSVRIMGTCTNGIALGATATYANANSAASAASMLKKYANASALLGLMGIRLQKLDIQSDGNAVRIAIAMDDASLRKLLASAPEWLGLP